MKNAYKEYFEVKNEEEVKAVWCMLRDKGYLGSEIYVARYQGNDGKFHRNVFVFNKEV